MHFNRPTNLSNDLQKRRLQKFNYMERKNKTE